MMSQLLASDDKFSGYHLKRNKRIPDWNAQCKDLNKLPQHESLYFYIFMVSPKT